MLVGLIEALGAAGRRRDESAGGRGRAATAAAAGGARSAANEGLRRGVAGDDRGGKIRGRAGRWPAAEHAGDGARRRRGRGGYRQGRLAAEHGRDGGLRPAARAAPRRHVGTAADRPGRMPRRGQARGSGGRARARERSERQPVAGIVGSDRPGPGETMKSATADPPPPVEREARSRSTPCRRPDRAAGSSSRRPSGRRIREPSGCYPPRCMHGSKLSRGRGRRRARVRRRRRWE